MIHATESAPPEDNALIAQFVDSEGKERKDALAQLYDRFHTPLFAFAKSMGLQSSDAEDVVHTTFLKVMQRAEQYVSGNFRPWIFTIARNAIFDARSKKSPTTQPEIEITSDRPDETRSLGEILSQLGEMDAALLRGLYADELSIEQLASKLGISVAATYKRHERALKKLHEAEQSQRMIEALSDLPARYREVIFGLLIDGVPSEIYARERGLTIDRVRDDFYQAMRMMHLFSA